MRVIKLAHGHLSNLFCMKTTLTKCMISSGFFHVKNVITKFKKSKLSKQQELIQTECENKPKLRAFLTFKDFKTLPPHVGKQLSFIEHKTINKLRLGILPIRLETARSLRPVVNENQLLCYCDSGEMESELYMLLKCPKYNSLREAWLSKHAKPLH